MQDTFYTNVVKRGQNLLVREFSHKHNREIRKKIKYQPTMYIKSTSNDTQFHDIKGVPVTPKKFKDMKTCDDFISKYKDYNGVGVFGNDEYTTQYIREEYKDATPDKSKIRTFNLDIEVQSAVQMYEGKEEFKIKRGGVEKPISRTHLLGLMQKLDKGKLSGVSIETHNGYEPIEYFRFTHDDGFPKPELAMWPLTAITIHDSFTGKYHVWGFGNLEWDPIVACKKYSKELHRQHLVENPQHGLTVDDIIYTDCVDEKDLLNKIMGYWQTNCPNIVTGWNSNKFDLVYMYRRIERLFTVDSTKVLSPWGVVTVRQSEDSYGNMCDIVNILGVDQMDYMELYKKYSFRTPDNYKLDTIGDDELGDGKMSYDEAGSLRTLFRSNYQHYIEYNIVDVAVVGRIELKRRFFDIVITIAYLAGCTFENTMSPVKTWDAITTNHLMAQNTIVPLLRVAEKTRKYAGAFVKPIKPCRVGWTVSVDLSSLYPHLIMQWNIGPETMVKREELPDNIRNCVNNVTTYDFDECGNPITEGPRGRDEYMSRLARNEIDLSFMDDTGMGIAGNLACFKNDTTSFLSILMEGMYEGRSFDKAQMLHYKQELEWVNNNIKDKTYTLTDDVMLANRVERLKLTDTFFFKNGMSLTELKDLQFRLVNEVSRLGSLEMAKKILLNSMYGSLGSVYSRWFSIEMAEAITLSGQLANIFIAHRLNVEINRIMKNPKPTNGDDHHTDYITYQDTDSDYINVDPIVEKFKPVEYAAAANGCVESKDIIVDFLDKMFDTHFKKFMDNAYLDLQKYTNAKKQKMNMDREGICQAGIWLGAKSYTLKVWDNEGVRYKDPYWKVMGLSAVKSTTPKIVRGWLKDSYKIFVDGTESQFHDKITEYKNMWDELPVHAISKNMACNGINKNANSETIFNEGSSWQSKCGLYYNDLVDKLGLEREVDKIIDGEKVKLIELKMPNPIHHNKIAFPAFLSSKLGLDEYIDRKTAFTKNVVVPLQSFMDIRGWDTESRPTLDDFM